MKRLAYLLIAAILMGLACSCKQQTSDSTPKNPSQTLIVYSTFKEEQISANLTRFDRETGIQGVSIRLSAGDALERLLSEGEKPKADIVYGGSIDMYLQMEAEGLLEPYISPNAATIPDAFKSPEGYFTGVFITYLVIVYNKTLLAEKNLTPPASWQDLLAPEYQGQVAMASPTSSGTAYTFLSTMCQLYGEDAGMEYLSQLDRNITAYQKTGAAPARLVAQGEALVGISFLHDVIYYQDKGFSDLVAVIPAEGAGYDVGCIGIVKNGPNSESAKAFLDYALTPESVRVQEDAGYFVGYTLPAVEVPDELRQFGEIQTIPNDFHWAGSNRARLVEAWSAMVQRHSE